MSGYHYETQKAWLFTDEGQRDFLKVRDNVGRLIALAGAVRWSEAVKGLTGDTWNMLAIVDRMVELGELREVTGPNVWGQHRVFVKAEGR